MTGELGESGNPGFDGIRGKKGESGIAGLSGFAGKRCLSLKIVSFQSRHVYSGNLTISSPNEQLLPITGVDGQKGTPGNQGDKGFPGISGKDGHPGFPGFPGNRGNVNGSLSFVELHDLCFLFHVVNNANTRRVPWLEGSLWITWTEGPKGSSRSSR